MIILSLLLEEKHQPQYIVNQSTLWEESERSILWAKKPCSWPRDRSSHKRNQEKFLWCGWDSEGDLIDGKGIGRREKKCCVFHSLVM